MGFLVALLFLLSQAPSPQQGWGTVSGRVLELGGDPIAGLQVVLTEPLGGSYRTETDSTGAFRVRVPPGTYQVSFLATRNQLFFRPPQGGGPTQVQLAENESLEIQLSLLRTGAISGRVTNVRGTPLTNARIDVLEPRYRDGRLYLVEVISEIARTDDRGQYRFFGLLPGKYYVRATLPPDDLKSLFPGVATVTAAEQVQVGAGEEATAIDWIFDTQGNGSISGSISMPPEVRAIAMAARRFYLGFYYFLNSVGDTPEYRSRALEVDASGRFTIPALPGLYDLTIYRTALATTPSAGPITSFRADSGGQSVSYVWQGAVDTRFQEVQDLAVSLMRTGDIEGQVKVTGGALPFRLDRLRVSLVAPRDLRTLGVLGSAVRADGAFRIPGVPGSRYALRIEGLGDLGYIDEVTLNGAVVEADGIRVSNEILQKLVAEVRIGGRTINGTVEKDERTPVPYTEVVLVPQADLRWNPVLYKSTRTDANGNFSFQAVAPGTYKVFAWEHLPNSRDAIVAGTDDTTAIGADFVEKYEALGVTVDVRFSSIENVQVRLIANIP